MKKIRFSRWLAALGGLLLVTHLLPAQGTVGLVPRQSIWRYQDLGPALDPAWTGPDYDDSAWPIGPARLGFGGDGERTVLRPGPQTFLFRHGFMGTSAMAVSNLQVRLARDDGAAVYLNGVEIFRSNMPTGMLRNVTFASAPVNGAAETNVFLSSILTRSLLSAGRNVLAVEVHQASANDGDLGFDLELVGDLAPAGVLTVSVPAGWSTFANSANRAGNTLAELLPQVADGTEIYKWNPAAQIYEADIYDANLGGWTFDLSLPPGEGAWIHSPVNQSLTVPVGQAEPPGSLPRPPGGGLRFVGCRRPVASTFEEVMGFPPAEGDRVLLYEGHFPTRPNQPTRIFTFDRGAWSPTAPPLVEPGVGIFGDLTGSCPSLSCPADITTNCAAGGGAPVTYAVQAGNLCNPNAFAVTCVPPSGDLFPVGTTFVVCTNRDPVFGRTAVCGFKVTVRDMTPPAMLCAPDQTVENGTAWAFDPPVVTDACCGTNVTLRVVSTVTNAGLCESTFIRTWRALDCSSNSSFCSQTVTILDTQPPVLHCPTNLTANCAGDNDARVDFLVTATDAGELVPVVCWPHSGSLFPVGVTAVNCRATDPCNHASQCGFNVTVLSNCPIRCLQLTCPGDTNVPCQTPEGAVFRFAPIASNLCDPTNLTVLCRPASGSVFRLGSTPVICVATGSGQTNACSFSVTVTGSCELGENCLSLRCPDPILVRATSPEGAEVSFAPVAENPCHPQALTVWCVPPYSTRFPIGTSQVTCWASADGRTVHCRFPITVVDKDACVIAAPVGRTIRGHVTAVAGGPLAGVQVTLTGLSEAGLLTAVTDAEGNYVLPSVAAEGTYRIEASRPTYVITPPATTIGPLASDAELNFSGISAYESWQKDHWGSFPLPAGAGAQEDADGDGQANLLEYAQGGNPLVRDTVRGVILRSSLPEEGASHMVMEVEVSPVASDVVVGVQVKPMAVLSLPLPWVEALRYYPAGRDGGSAPAQDWVLDWFPPTAFRPLAAPRHGLAVDLPPDAPALAARLSVCLLTECGGLTGTPSSPGVGSEGTGSGDSLRIGWFNAQALAQIPGTEPTSGCCENIPARMEKLADRIAATGFDVIALGEMQIEGDDCAFLAFMVYGEDYEAEIARRYHNPVTGAPYTLAEWCTMTDMDSGKIQLASALRARGYHHFVRFLDDPRPWVDLKQDSGLVLFSRFPFAPFPAEIPEAYHLTSPNLVAESAGRRWTEVAFVPYDACRYPDCLAHKGAGLVRILNPSTGQIYNVVFTHMQANGEPEYQEVRAAQFEQVHGMIRDLLGESPTEPVIMVGDLNVHGQFTHADYEGPEGEWYKTFGAGGGFFARVLHDAWDAQIRLPVPEPFLPRRDQGISYRDSQSRYDYLLVNDVRKVDNLQLVVQHMAIAASLRYSDPTLGQTYTEAAFGRAGMQNLSDHYGIIADLNFARTGEPRSPDRARVANADLDDAGADHAAGFRGMLERPGQMYWLCFTNPGTYSLALEASGPAAGSFRYHVYAIDDLSLPLGSLLGKSRTLVDQETGCRFQARVYASPNLPVLVRIWNDDRTATGGFTLRARRHQCASPDDFCELLPNDPVPTRVTYPDHPTGGSLDRYFHFDAGSADSGRAVTNTVFVFGPSSVSTDPTVSLSVLDDDAATVLISATGLPIGPSRLETKYPDLGGTERYLKFTPASLPAGRAFDVGWETDLTVLTGRTPEFPDEMLLRCVAQNDSPDIFGEDDDDIMVRVKLVHPRLDGALGPDGLPLLVTNLIRGPKLLVRDWDRGHEEAVEHVLRTIRFLPDEKVILQLIENDDAGYDASDLDFNGHPEDGTYEEGEGDFEYLEAELPLLPVSEFRSSHANAEAQEVRCRDGCGGSYRLYFNQHHGRPRTEHP